MPDGAPGNRAALEESGRRSFAAAAQFRADDPYRALEAAFAYGPAETATHALLADSGWVGALIAPLIAALAEDPWFEPPFRVARDGLRIGAIVFENAAVSITATVLSADALAATPPPRSVVLAGRLTLTRYVRGGGARLRTWQAPAAAEDFDAAAAPRCVALPDRSLADGDVIRHDGRTHGQILADATSDVVTLGVTLRAETAPLACEYALPEGTFLRVATNDDRAARTQMLLAYLRLAGRRDARCYDAATRDGAFFLRWAAMREWLAVDVRAALPRLRELAHDPNAEVRAAASVTLASVERKAA